MKLYKVRQSEVFSHEAFSSMVVCAANSIAAACIHPLDEAFPDQGNWDTKSTRVWCTKPEFSIVEYLGEARIGLEKGVICSSFYAG